MVIGLIGGCGTGKTEAAEYLKTNYGAYPVIGDEVAHRIIKRGEAAYCPLLEAFGNEILSEDLEIDRRKLGAMVFGNPENIQTINRITHPLIYDAMNVMISKKRQESPDALIVLEAAIMIEARLYELVDEIWMIHADEETRLERLQKGRGISRDQALRMISSQPTAAQFRSYSDHIIDNNNAFDKTIAQIDRFLAKQEQSHEE